LFSHREFKVGNVEMKTISILIPTRNPEIQTPLIPFIPHEILISTILGVTEARRSLVEKSSGELLIMIDDDVTVPDHLWIDALHLQKGSFMMSMGRNHPITRFLAIHKKDYLKVGGFDLTFQNGEDYDFYLRAIKIGLKSIILDREVIHHKEHSRHFDLRVPWDAGKLRARHSDILRIRWFIKLNPLIFIIQIVSLIYHRMCPVAYPKEREY